MSTAAVPTWQRILRCRAEIASHGVKVLAFCLAVALVLWLARPDQGLDVQLAYSFGTGIISWLLIDLGRFFVDPQSPYGFPRGWRAVALIGVGCALGHLLGTALGNWYCGRTAWDQLFDQPRFFAYFFFLSMGIGGAISYYFYSVGKSSYLKSELEASQRQTVQAQLQLLQSQLEPHMLFNTLANLRALIGTDPSRAQAMLDRLNDYLRATLSASRSTAHPLQAEFDRLRDYLELMAVRMGPRLGYTLDLPEALRQAPVPPLLLQPLVENSIKHGLEPKVEGGHIRVSARQQGDRIQLQVSDTGANYLPEGDNPARFGLDQVRQRLATLHGTDATFSIASCADFTLASIEFPYTPS